MTALASNPPGKRLAYVAKQFKNYPAVIFDVVRVVAKRIGSRDWSVRFVAAAREADLTLYDDMRSVDIVYEGGDDLQGMETFRARYLRCMYLPDIGEKLKVPSYRGDPAAVDVDEVRRGCNRIWSGSADALVAAVGELPEFKRPHEIDPFIAWGAKELALFMKEEKVDAYDALVDVLTENPDLFDWFRKKKPDLTKMSAQDLVDALEAFEKDRVPETVFEWDDGWKVVKLITSTQLDRVGKALDNCLRRDSSYHEGFCEKAKKGDADYYALLGRTGNPVVSVEWLKRDKSPGQVYAARNEEPEGIPHERIAEWIESKGGEYGEKDPLDELGRSTRRIAEYIIEHSHADTEDAISYAHDWDENFSGDDAIAWIEQLGEHAYDFANALEGIGLDADDWSKVSSPVRYWIDELHSQGDGIDNDEVKHGLLADAIYQGMVEAKATRAHNAPRASRQTAFEFRGEPKARPLPPLPPKLLMALDDNANIDLFREAWVWAEAWIEYAEKPEEWAEDAGKWWSKHFGPEEAAIYEFAVLDERGNSVPLEAALELRERGISAHELAEAAREAKRTFNVRSADELQDLVETYRASMRVNRRRRSNQPRRRSNRHGKRRTSRRSGL